MGERDSHATVNPYPAGGYKRHERDFERDVHPLAAQLRHLLRGGQGEGEAAVAAVAAVVKNLRVPVESPGP